MATFGTQVALAALLAVLWVLYKRIQPRQSVKHGDLEHVIEPLPDFDWTTASPRALRPFRPIYHITMALQSDTPSDLITIDKDYLNRVTLRRSLIEKHPATVHGCTQHGGAAVHEVYSYLMEYLPTRYPTIFNKTSDGKRLLNRATGKMFDVTPPADTEYALRVLGETVEEDLFLLRKTDAGHESVAFMCCFPSGFDPSTKLGRLLSQIHEGVPSYERIGASMEKFFSKLEVGKSVKRINWSFQTHEDLFNCKGNHGDEDDKEENIDMEKTFARMELQTLTRLPKTGALLFSFKTYLYPVKELKDEGIGEEVAQAIEGLGKGNAPGMWKYKGTVRWGKRVCEYLRE